MFSSKRRLVRPSPMKRCNFQPGDLVQVEIDKGSRLTARGVLPTKELPGFERIASRERGFDRRDHKKISNPSEKGSRSVLFRRGSFKFIKLLVLGGLASRLDVARIRHSSRYTQPRQHPTHQNDIGRKDCNEPEPIRHTLQLLLVSSSGPSYPIPHKPIPIFKLNRKCA